MLTSEIVVASGYSKWRLVTVQSFWKMLCAHHATHMVVLLQIKTEMQMQDQSQIKYMKPPTTYRPLPIILILSG